MTKKKGGKVIQMLNPPVITHNNQGTYGKQSQ